MKWDRLVCTCKKTLNFLDKRQAEKEFLLDKHQYVPSYSQETREVILAHFRSIISHYVNYLVNGSAIECYWK